jgi:hypothetical protein
MKSPKALLALFVSLTALSPVMAQTPSVPAATAATVVPPLIRYSGVVRDPDGKALATNVGISFLIYKDEEGGSPLWVESQSLALDGTGHYLVQLGAASMNGIPLDLFANGEARWLEVQVAGQKPQPRVLLVSVPYALKAADAATLGGLPASAFALAGDRNAPVAAASAETNGITPNTVTNVTTTGGSSGFVPVFTGGSTVVNSIIEQTASGVGIGDAPNATLDVNGKTILRGIVNLSRTGNATPAAGTNSFGFSFNAMAWDSAKAANVSPVYTLQAEATGNNTDTPGATLNLIYTNGYSGGTNETGFYINPNGTIHFSPSQTFPGSGGTITGVTAGTALTGGGTSGTVALNLDTTKVPLLAAANHFTGNQSVTGSVSSTGQLISTIATGTAPLSVASTTVVANLNASLLGGLAASSFASTAASNSFTGVQSFSQVGVGTTTPRSLLEISTKALAALGPDLTLTNTAGGSGAESAVDFNTVAPSATGTYNPMARIAAQDALHYSDNLLFQSNTPGAPNNGLQTNMSIQSTGLVGINTLSPAAQLEVDSSASLGTDALQAYGATNSSGNGTIGIDGYGGDGISAGSGGAGGNFYGGYAEGSGPGGDGIDAYPGGASNSATTQGYAGYFNGDVLVSGTLSAGAKDFEIDHPLDPANKYLDHASVESSEMVNIYSGNVTTDALGIATVQLPAWFESVNTDFRYQLTVVGKFAQAIISQEIANHQFKISTNASYTKVSWQVTGVRQDAFARAHPLVVEREKPAAERGFYAHPELYGQPAEKQTQWARHPEAMRRMKAARTAHASVKSAVK